MLGGLGKDGETGKSYIAGQGVGGDDKLYPQSHKHSE